MNKQTMIHLGCYNFSRKRLVSMRFQWKFNDSNKLFRRKSINLNSERVARQIYEMSVKSEQRDCFEKCPLIPFLCHIPKKNSHWMSGIYVQTEEDRNKGDVCWCNKMNAQAEMMSVVDWDEALDNACIRLTYFDKNNKYEGTKCHSGSNQLWLG